MLWSGVIDVLRGSLFVLAHWCGGSLGAAIFLASVGLRLAMLPVTLGATRRRLVRERDDVKSPDPRALLDGLLLFPPAAALYAAVRAAAPHGGGFLWIASLAKPDVLIATTAAFTAAGAAWFAAATPVGKGTPMLLPVVLSAVISFAFLSHMSAGVAVYSVANSLVGAAERALARRTLPTRA
jgi:membrane protein insertase Oxa1/YidC/SpoIIIJ